MFWVNWIPGKFTYFMVYLIVVIFLELIPEKACPTLEKGSRPIKGKADPVLASSSTGNPSVELVCKRLNMSCERKKPTRWCAFSGISSEKITTVRLIV